MISRIRSATGDLNPASLALSSSSVLPSMSAPVAVLSRLSATPSWAAAPVVSEITTQPEAAATLATRMPPDRISEIASKTLRLRQRALAEGRTNFTFILRKDEIHDWPTFPFLPEAHRDLPAIERQLLGTDV